MNTSEIDSSLFIPSNSLEMNHVSEFDAILLQRSSPSPHVVIDPIISLTHNLVANSSGEYLYYISYVVTLICFFNY